MEKEEKKIYNREHYKKNRQRILEKSKERLKGHTKIVPLFGGPIPFSQKEKSFRRIVMFLSPSTLSCFGMSILIVAMSYFLISESIKFYLKYDNNLGEAILKALILEGTVIAFALIKRKSGFYAYGQKVMVALIYSYSVWLLSSSVIQAAYAEHRQFEVKQAQLRDLQATVTQKEMMRNAYWNSSRFTLARKYDSTIDRLNHLLTQTRSELVRIPDNTTILNTVAALVIFRILVMISNLFCIQHLGQMLQASRTKTKRPQMI